MRSSILWIVALTGPNSMTCGHQVEMKRPSDVPPVVESSGWMPATCAIASPIACDSVPRGVRNGAAPSVHASVYSTP